MTFAGTDYEQWSTDIPSDVYGALLGGWVIKQGLINTLRKWLPSYVAEFNRQIAVGFSPLPQVQDFEYKPDYRAEPPAPGAAILTSSGGISGDPYIDGDGVIAGRWNGHVEVYLFGTTDWNETEMMTYAYAAMVRGAIMQHGSLGGVASGAKYLAEKYFEGEHTAVSRGMASLDFGFVLPDQTNINDGPPDPSLLPAPDWPEVTKTITTLEKEDSL